MAFLDSHVNYFGGDTPPSGEAADMDLAIVCGYGHAGLVDMAGSVPMVDSGEVLVIGYHPDSEDASPREDELVGEPRARATSSAPPAQGA
jgi:arginase